MRVFNIKARTLRLLLASMLLFTVSCTRQQFENFLYCAALALNPFAFLFGGTQLARSQDGGDTFDQVTFQINGIITDMALGPNGDAWGVTNNGILFRCDPSGNNCIEVPLNIGDNYEFHRLKWFGDFGYIAANKGQIIRTSNGGNNWLKIDTGLNIDLRSITCDEINASICYTVGINGVLGHSVDFGLTWNAQTSGTSQQLNDVTTIGNGLTAWAVGNNYALTYTIDGSNWMLHDNPNNLTNDLNRVHFKDANNGIIVGRNIIERTSNGEDFIPVALSPAQFDNFKSMNFDTDFGIIIGEFGQGAKTDNFGDTYTFFEVPLRF